MNYAILDYDGFICKAFYAAIARDDIDSAYEILEDLTNTAIEKAYKEFNNEPTRIIRAYSKHNWKKEVYPDYKANRKKNEFLGIFRDSVINQEVACTEDFIGFDGLEADDIITVLLSGLRNQIIVFSDDKDLHHLSSLYCKVNITEEPQINPFKFGFYEQLLAGDKEDNITGIPGIGMVKAEKLLDGNHTYPNVIKIYKSFNISKEECEKNLNLITPIHSSFNNNYGSVYYLAQKIINKQEVSKELIKEVIDGQRSFISDNVNSIYGV